uniref:ATP synthase subunit a n=1 Tax=Placopecten magellanicus TaxID=6577 RepID=Q4FE10_PLAMG|nr:ATP synthase F0 subunit 6 [Placopecten magellanicus]AAZ06455.1 ATP synthase subunit 6 [Placopecten magellanicus]
MSLSLSTYFDQFDWSISLGGLVSMGFPFVILQLLGNPLFLSGGFLEASFTWVVMSLAKAFTLLGAGSKSGSAHFLCFLSVVLLTANLSGMLPFVQSASSSGVFSFCGAFLFWGVGALSSLQFSSKFFSSLWVKGAPLMVNVVVVLSELMSWLVRPSVMGVRLLVNVVCGHILLAMVGELVGSLFFSGSWHFALLGLLGGCFIGCLEWAVMVVQALIFVGMVVWSWSDSPMRTSQNWWSAVYCWLRFKGK